MNYKEYAIKMLNEQDINLNEETDKERDERLANDMMDQHYSRIDRGEKLANDMLDRHYNRIYDQFLKTFNEYLVVMKEKKPFIRHFAIEKSLEWLKISLEQAMDIKNDNIKMTGDTQGKFKDLARRVDQAIQLAKSKESK